MTMTSTARSYPAQLRAGASWACLVAGIICGAVSVYSDSRAACAVWVTAALVLMMMAGVAIGRWCSRRPPQTG